MIFSLCLVIAILFIVLVRTTRERDRAQELAGSLIRANVERLKHGNRAPVVIDPQESGEDHQAQGSETPIQEVVAYV